MNYAGSQRAVSGVSGNLSTETKRVVDDTMRYQGKATMGDRAAAVAAEYAVFMADWTYIVCTRYPKDADNLRWRRGRKAVFGQGQRKLPLVLDSAAFRIWSGTAPRWATMDRYLAAIILTEPDGYFAFDEIGDQVRSLLNYQYMRAQGFEPIPVYHVRPRWNPRLDLTAPAWRNIAVPARTAVANARLAAEDPTLRLYVEQNQLIGLGGMVRGPVPRDWRHYYIAELCRQFPDHQFWALGQANFKVVNGLGAMGLLDRVSTDGTWYLLDAACERMAVVNEGRIKMLSLEGVAQSFFTMGERIAANLRSLLAAYAGLWEWPPPDPIPDDLDDPDQVVELHQRVQQAKFEMFGDGPVRTYGNVAVSTTYD